LEHTSNLYFVNLDIKISLVTIRNSFINSYPRFEREFAWEFSQLSCSDQTRIRVAWELWELRSESLHKNWWELRSESCMRIFSTLMSWSNENKSCMRVDKGWEARVCMRIFSTLMARSNENKSCMRVDKDWEARVSMRVFSTFMPRSNENKSCMRVDKGWQARVYMRVFSTLMPRSNENKSCMRVDKGWQARVSMRVFSTLMPRSNENKSWMKADDSWETRVCMRVFSALVLRSNENKSCMRVDESWLDINARAQRKRSSTLIKIWNSKSTRVHESWWELAVKRKRELQLSSTLHPRLTEALFSPDVDNATYSTVLGWFDLSSLCISWRTHRHCRKSHRLHFQHCCKNQGMSLFSLCVSLTELLGRTV
jgi:hypothetical protein